MNKRKSKAAKFLKKENKLVKLLWKNRAYIFAAILSPLIFFAANIVYTQANPSVVVLKETVYRTAYLEPTVTQTVTTLTTATVILRSSNGIIISNSTSSKP